jgi:hypothetical protein
VQNLQARGFSLPAIGELIKARESGASVSDVLGLGGGDAHDEWVPCKVRDLRRLVEMRLLRPSLLRKATDLGLLRWRRGRPLVRRWALDSGMHLAETAIPSDEVLDEFEHLKRATDEITARFVAVFERRLWPRMAEQSEQPDQLERVRALLVDLTATAERTMLGALRESMRDAAEDFARRHELLPSDGPAPAWMEHPVPLPAESFETGADERNPAESEIERFLSGEPDD